MTSGDEAGALKEEIGADTDTEAHNPAAPAEPDPGGAGTDDSAGTDELAGVDDSAGVDELAGETAREPEEAAKDADVSAEAPAQDVSEDAGSAEASAGAGDAEVGDAEDDSDSEDDSGDEVDNWVPDDTREVRPAGVWAVTVAVLVVMLIAGVWTASSYWGKANSASSATTGQAAAESVAKTAVTDLISADYKDPQSYAAKLKPLAVGQFLSEFGNASAGFGKILTEGKVQTSGQVENVGVEQFNGTTAQLAVLANVLVKNTESPQGSQRVYRLKVSMVQSGSKWLVSNVEFVQ